MQAEEEVSRSEEDEAASGNEAADVDAVDGGAAAAPSPEGVAADGDAAGAVDVAAGDAHGVADGGFGPAPAAAAAAWRCPYPRSSGSCAHDGFERVEGAKGIAQAPAQGLLQDVESAGVGPWLHVFGNTH